MQILKKILQYTVLLIIGIIFLKYAYKDFSYQDLLIGLKNTNFSWIILAFLSNIINHIIRAYRWYLLMQPIGYHPPIFRMFLAEMTGFFANLLVPRLGEFVRCKALNRMEKIPIGASFITVIAERILDLTSFSLIALVSFLIYGNKITGGLSINSLPSIKLILLVSLILILILIIITIIIFKYYPMVIKYIKKYFKSAISGFKSLVNSKHIFLIIILTFLVWVFYFFVGVFIFKSSLVTSKLGVDAGLAVFLTSNLGMAAPVQGGGAGAFHNLVAASLAIFDIDKKGAILYATLAHSIQFITALVIGGISTSISFLVKPKKLYEPHREDGKDIFE